MPERADEPPSDPDVVVPLWNQLMSAHHELILYLADRAEEAGAPPEYLAGLYFLCSRQTTRPRRARPAEAVATTPPLMLIKTLWSFHMGTISVAETISRLRREDP